MSGAGSGSTKGSSAATEVHTLSNDGVINDMTNSCMFISIYDWMMLRQLNASTEGAEESKGDGNEEFRNLISKSLKLSKILHIMKIYCETHLRRMRGFDLGKYLHELYQYTTDVNDTTDERGHIVLGTYFSAIDLTDSTKGGMFEAIGMAKNKFSEVNREIFNCMLKHSSLKISVKHLRRLIGHDIYTFYRDIDEHVRDMIDKFKHYIGTYENRYASFIEGTPLFGELIIGCYENSKAKTINEYIRDTINSYHNITSEKVRALISIRLEEEPTSGKPDGMDVDDYIKMSIDKKIDAIIETASGMLSQTQLVIDILARSFESTMGHIQRVFTDSGMEDHTHDNEMTIDELRAIVRCVNDIDRDNIVETCTRYPYRNLRNDLIPTSHYDRARLRSKIISQSIPIPLNADGQNTVEHEMWDSAYPGHRQSLFNLANMLSCNIHVNSSPGSGSGQHASFTHFEYENNKDDERPDLANIDIKNMTIKMTGTEKKGDGHFQFIYDETAMSKKVDNELLVGYNKIRDSIASADADAKLSELFDEYDKWVQTFYRDMIASGNSVLTVVLPELPPVTRVKPSTATPVKPSTATPAKPSTATPVKPSTATPAKPSTATPAKPSTAAPAESEISITGLSDSVEPLYYSGVEQPHVKIDVRRVRQYETKISHKHDEKIRELESEIAVVKEKMTDSIKSVASISARIESLYESLLSDETSDDEAEFLIKQIESLNIDLKNVQDGIVIDTETIERLKTELSKKL